MIMGSPQQLICLDQFDDLMGFILEANDELPEDSARSHGNKDDPQFASSEEAAAATLRVPASSDEDHGSVTLMNAYPRSELSRPLLVEQLFDHLKRKDEYAAEFYVEGPRTNAWRMAGRLCCVNTSVQNEANLTKRRAIDLIRGFLGPEFCPADETLQKCRDGFWIVAVSLTVLIKQVVTPRRARACFKRYRNQKYVLSEYGRDLLGRNDVSWPPIPDFQPQLRGPRTTRPDAERTALSVHRTMKPSPMTMAAQLLPTLQISLDRVPSMDLHFSSVDVSSSLDLGFFSGIDHYGEVIDNWAHSLVCVS